MKIRNNIMAALMLLLSGIQQSVAMDKITNPLVDFIVTNFEECENSLNNAIDALDKHSDLFEEACHIFVFFDLFNSSNLNDRVKLLRKMQKKAPAVYECLKAGIKKRQENEEAGPEAVEPSRLQAFLEAIKEEEKDRTKQIKLFFETYVVRGDFNFRLEKKVEKLAEYRTLTEFYKTLMQLKEDDSKMYELIIAPPAASATCEKNCFEKIRDRLSQIGMINRCLSSPEYVVLKDVYEQDRDVYQLALMLLEPQLSIELQVALMNLSCPDQSKNFGDKLRPVVVSVVVEEKDDQTTLDAQYVLEPFVKNTPLTPDKPLNSAYWNLVEKIVDKINECKKNGVLDLISELKAFKKLYFNINNRLLLALAEAPDVKKWIEELAQPKKYAVVQPETVA